METYKNLKKSTKIGLILFSILCLLELVISIVALVQGAKTEPISILLHDVGRIALLALLFAYSMIGYKKPHGNMLKAVFIAFGAYLVFFATLNIASLKVYVSADCILIAAMMIVYMAGRLDRLKNNFVLLMVAESLLVVGAILAIVALPWQGEQINLFSVNGSAAAVVILPTVAFAYVARYEEHKAAGLADKQDA